MKRCCAVCSSLSECMAAAAVSASIEAGRAKFLTVAVSDAACGRRRAVSTTERRQDEFVRVPHQQPCVALAGLVARVVQREEPPPQPLDGALVHPRGEPGPRGALVLQFRPGQLQLLEVGIEPIADGGAGGLGGRRHGAAQARGRGGVLLKWGFMNWPTAASLLRLGGGTRSGFRWPTVVRHPPHWWCPPSVLRGRTFRSAQTEVQRSDLWLDLRTIWVPSGLSTQDPEVWMGAYGRLSVI